MAKSRSTPLFILVAVITAIAALYIAKAILLPLALAILLTFLLTPLADRLERWGAPRVPATLGVVAISFLILGFLGGVVTNQLVNISQEFPQHKTELIKKLRSLRPDSPTLEKITKTLSDIRNAVIQEKEPDEEGQPSTPNAASRSESTTIAQTSQAEVKLTKSEPAPASATADGHPSQGRAQSQNALDVIVSERPASMLQQIQEVVGRVIEPIATGGLVIVLVLFLLLDRENQRSRLIQLFGRSHVHTTTRAFRDASGRVGRYLRMLFLLNAGYGATVAVGLWLIGVPGAILWGVLGFALRFLPYIGPWIAATLPILVSIAMSPGWTQPLLVVGLYIIIELVSNNIVEPLVYGNTTGVSTIGVILSAIFWTWLWGPLGLILAMPMTVCLLVAAAHVPQLKFLTILLADRPPQTPAERVYQRLLAFDDREPMKLARTRLSDAPLENYYDDVLLPALVMAEHDRVADLLSDEQIEFVMGAAEDIIGELENAAQDMAEQRTDRKTEASGSPVRVLCMPLRDEGDEMAARMLAQLLAADGFAAHAGTAESLTGELVEQVAETESDIVVISVLPPITPRDSRLLWRRLRNRYPHLPIVIGFWTAESEKEALAEPVADANSRVVTKLDEAVAVVRSLAARQRPAAKTG